MIPQDVIDLFNEVEAEQKALKQKVPESPKKKENQEIPKHVIDLFNEVEAEQKSAQEKKEKSSRKNVEPLPWLNQNKTAVERKIAPDLPWMKPKQTSKAISEFGKGALSGASFGLSELAPSLKPEGSFPAAAGEFLGSIGPIELTYKLLGKPLVNYVIKSGSGPLLTAFARMTGWGLTGAGYESAKDYIKHGELPSTSDIAKHGATWALFDGALQATGAAAKFGSSVLKSGVDKKEFANKIAEKLESSDINPSENPERAVEIGEETLNEMAEKQPTHIPETPKIEGEVSLTETPANRVSAIQPPPITQDLPTPSKPSFVTRFKDLVFKKDTNISRAMDKEVKEYYKKKWGLEWDNYYKWKSKFEQEKFSDQDLSDVAYYIEKTGNPFNGPKDTFEALNSRMSEKAKHFADNVVTPHFEKWREVINSSAYTKDINPREFLEGVYVPHLYTGDTKQGAKQAAQILSKKFSTKNPFANKRTFLTYNEALVKAGLKPKYDNIKDILNEYDKIMTRVLTNSELAGKIKEMKGSIDGDLVINHTNPRYAKMKADGWIPFEDSYLRRYVAGSDKNGKAIFATSELPALVHPEAADAFTGVFLRDLKKPGFADQLWKPFETASDWLKSLHVSFSGFHYLTLAEESAKASGVRLLNNYKRGAELLKDPVFMKDYVEAGGVVGHNPELIHKSSENLDKLEKSLRIKGGKSAKVGNAIKGLTQLGKKFSSFLFEKLQPRWKVAAFYDMRKEMVRKLEKSGVKITPEIMKQVNEELAVLSNDMFGGQRLELMKNPTNLRLLDIKDPTVAKAWKRAGGYVDWTLSALKEFGKTAKGFFELLPGTPKTVAGYAARKNFMRYAKNIFMATQFINYLNSGLYRKSDGSISWDINRAHSTFEHKDPSKHFWEFVLPDIEYDIAGMKYNPGRDEKGRRQYSHFGKKFLEIFHYAEDPIRQLFNKANPVWQEFFIQLAGGSPTLEGIPYKAQPVYQRGEQKAWEGKEGWGTVVPRLKHIAKSSAPYSLQSLRYENPVTAVGDILSSVGGSIPKTKGLNTKKAEALYVTYYTNPGKHQQDITRLDQALKDNGYDYKTIHRVKTLAKNEARKRSREK